MRKGWEGRISFISVFVRKIIRRRESKRLCIRIERQLRSVYTVYVAQLLVQITTLKRNFPLKMMRSNQSCVDILANWHILTEMESFPCQNTLLKVSSHEDISDQFKRIFYSQNFFYYMRERNTEGRWGGGRDCPLCDTVYGTPTGWQNQHLYTDVSRNTLQLFIYSPKNDKFLPVILDLGNKKENLLIRFSVANFDYSGDTKKMTLFIINFRPKWVGSKSIENSYNYSKNNNFQLKINFF